MFDQTQDSNGEKVNSHNNNDGQINQLGNEGQVNDQKIGGSEIDSSNSPNEEQVSHSSIGLAREEMYNEQDEVQPKQPVESIDDLAEQESLELPETVHFSKKKKIIIIVGIILGVILVSGGLLFAADRFFDIEIPFISKLFEDEVPVGDTGGEVIEEETPEEVIAQMFSSFKNIKTSKETFDLKLSAKDQDGNEQITSVLLAGERDLRQTGKQKTDYVFTFSQPHSDVKVSLDFRYVDEKAYIRLSQDSKIPLFDLLPLQNQWFYFDKQDKESLRGFVSDSGQVKAEFSEEEQEEILQIVKDAKLFKNVELVEDEMIESVSVFHYIAALDAEGFSEFMTKLEEVSQRRLKEQNLPVDFPKERIEEMRKSLQKIEDMPIEIWIEKGTYFLRRILVDNFEIEADKPDSKGGASILLNVEINNINEPVNIYAPEGGQSLGVVMQNLFGKWVSEMPLLQNGGAELGTMNMEKDDDGDGLLNGDEFFYNTDPANSDTDGDGYSDGDEVKNGYNPNGEGKL